MVRHLPATDCQRRQDNLERLGLVVDGIGMGRDAVVDEVQVVPVAPGAQQHQHVSIVGPPRAPEALRPAHAPHGRPCEGARASRERRGWKAGPCEGAKAPDDDAAAWPTAGTWRLGGGCEIRRARKPEPKELRIIHTWSFNDKHQPQKNSRRRAGEARLARPGRQHLEFNCQLDGWVGEWVGDEGDSKK